jgi:hypothetical protein
MYWRFTPAEPAPYDEPAVMPQHCRIRFRGGRRSPAVRHNRSLMLVS